MSPAEGVGAQRVLLYGLGVTNLACLRALTDHGHEVLVADDGPPEALDQLAGGGVVETAASPSAEHLASLVAQVDAVLPAPGLPDRHRVFAAAGAAELPVLSEFDLAAAWDDRPLVAVTGTNGKTTVTTLVSEILTTSGVPNAAVGNLEVPLVAAIADPSPEVFVVEASSFRLGRSRRFRPAVGAWLNFAPDHLDVHVDVESYRAAKARIWAEQRDGDVAVANAEDAVVAAAALALDGPTVEWFGGPVRGGPTPRWSQSDGRLTVDGDELLGVDELWSQVPHDRSNALAAAASAVAAGADLGSVREVLGRFDGLAHRVQHVATIDGVRWIDDSKATAPHATMSAIDGFDSVVLIAGGRNKGLDLSVLGAAAPRLRAVVGIGESAGEVLEALPDTPGRVASTMRDAVELARSAARPGDAVLLSPGCASFDWYGSYAERGDDFAAHVRSLAPGVAS